MRGWSLVLFHGKCERHETPNASGELQKKLRRQAAGLKKAPTAGNRQDINSRVIPKEPEVAEA